VAIISNHRKSAALRSWLETGILGEVEMDVGQAYNRFGISDRMIDDDTILTAYNFHVNEAPSQTDDLRSALTAIAKSRNSKLLQNFLNSGMSSTEHPLAQWPVGLQNIGNTCYLNSLLQFFFTVKPLRNLVLDFDKYKMEIDDVNLQKKRVGSRKVSGKEVERAQRCGCYSPVLFSSLTSAVVYELQKLFQSMITADRADVTPEPELARLTLISSTTEEHIRRQSILSGHRPSLGEIAGRPVLGPLLPSTDMLAGPDHDIRSSKPEATKKKGTPGVTDADGASEVTLVEGPINEDSDLIMLDTEGNEQKHQIVEDKENLPPSESLVTMPVVPENPAQLLGEACPSRNYAQQEILSSQEEKVHSLDDIPAPINGQPPNRPPPFPPRPKPEESKNSILEEVEIGAQQDVTEVIQNVLFQLQCAIQAEAIDETGEQLDLIKTLFFGKQKSYTTNREGLIRTKEEYISDIKVDVASGPRDIYAALDAAYDVQEVEVGGELEPQYTTISQLPPVLQIHVQRAQFDQERKLSFKSNHHLELKETLYMDRYMDSADADLLERRRQCWDWKKRVAVLEARRSKLSKTDVGALSEHVDKTNTAVVKNEPCRSPCGH
jgi:ubiquitin carboxyl-terminal hydrolase 25/28